MNTDLDTRITTALHDVASTTTVSDDALATIQRRAGHRGRPRRRRRLALTGVTLGAVGIGGGVTYAVIADQLSPGQRAIVEETRCDIESDNARLVASTESAGRSVEYWTVDDDGYSADLLFENGDMFGGGGCGPLDRAATRRRARRWLRRRVDAAVHRSCPWAPTCGTRWANHDICRTVQPRQPL
ncbi:MAG: hypothetical protein ACK5OX_02215 [Desertimonas sp.]